MRSQMEIMLSLIYRRERRCMEVLAKLRKGADGKAMISPEEAAEEIFKHESPSDQFLCFLLLVSLGDELVQRVIEDLGKRGDGAISVDEALDIMKDEINTQCRRAKAQTIKLIEGARKGKVIRIKEIS